MIRFTDSNEESMLKNVLNVLDRWYIAASGDEGLWIQPRQNVLDLREFCTLLKRIHRIYRSDRFKSLVFYFDGIETPKAVWIIILRLMTSFAKSMQTDCRIIRTDMGSWQTAPKFERENAASGMSGPGRRSCPMMRLSGITVMIKAPPAGLARLGMDRGRA